MPRKAKIVTIKNSKIRIDKKEIKEKRNIRKDPNAPKGSMSAYFYFISDRRNELQNINEEEIKQQFFKELALEWNNLDPKHKEPYIRKAEKDKERYQNESIRYNERLKREEQ